MTEEVPKEMGQEHEKRPRLVRGLKMWRLSYTTGRLSTFRDSQPSGAPFEAWPLRHKTPRSLTSRRPESVDLIYLDPPFNSNHSYNVLFRDESARTLAMRRL